MRGLMKNTAKLATGILFAAGLYHFAYQVKYPFKKINQNEKPLPKNEGELGIDWVSEANYAEQMENKVIPWLKEKAVKGRVAADEYQLDYTFYTLENPQASAVIVHGFKEYKEKYLEYVYYLLQAGIQVMTYDARDHGNSKLFEQNIQINLTDAEVLVSDLKTILDEMNQVSDIQKPKILIGHSMGGAVATALVQDNPHLIDGLILSSPMFAIHTYDIPNSLVYLYTGLSGIAGQGSRYIPLPAELSTPDQLTYQPVNDLVASEIRGKYYFDLNSQLHAYPVIGASINWLRSVIKLMQKVKNPTKIKAMTVPTLMFRAENDQIVKNKGITNMGYYMPQARSYVIKGAKHELYLSTDKVLQDYYAQVIQFILDLSE